MSIYDNKPNVRRRWKLTVLSLILIGMILLPVSANAQSGVSNLGLDASSIQLDKDRVAFLARESNQGGIDLNGDGDTGGRVLHVFETLEDIEIALFFEGKPR